MERIHGCDLRNSNRWKCRVCAGVITMMKEVHGVNENQQVNFCFTAGAIGLAIANQASISGAQGGDSRQKLVLLVQWQSAGLAELLLGGTSEQCGHAVALTLMNTMGLVCDPVAGLVEIPVSHEMQWGRHLLC